MYNRYSGNSGRVQRVQESHERRDNISTENMRASNRRFNTEAGTPVKMRNSPKPDFKPERAGPAELMGNLIPRLLNELETDDIIILLILYLMYRESGDTELLIIMGAMFLL